MSFAAFRASAAQPLFDKAVASARDVTRSLDDAVKAFQVCAAACCAGCPGKALAGLAFCGTEDAPDSSPTADVPESRDRFNSAVREVARAASAGAGCHGPRDG